MLSFFILEPMGRNMSMLKSSLTEHGCRLLVLFYWQSCHKVICTKLFFLTPVHKLLSSFYHSRNLSYRLLCLLWSGAQALVSYKLAAFGIEVSTYTCLVPNILSSLNSTHDIHWMSLQHCRLLLSFGCSKSCYGQSAVN